jgi:hypothetical protein
MGKRSRRDDAPEGKFLAEESKSAPCGCDLFVIFDGKRIARRGYPGTPQAGQWVPLMPGFAVADTDGGNGLVIEIDQHSMGMH